MSFIFFPCQIGMFRSFKGVIHDCAFCLFLVLLLKFVFVILFCGLLSSRLSNQFLQGLWIVQKVPITSIKGFFFCCF